MVEKVSVLSRGIYFPNQLMQFASDSEYYEFPSPLGVSIFQIEYCECDEEGDLFPSPLGVSIFQIKHIAVIDVELVVSGPSRGIYFPNSR